MSNRDDHAINQEQAPTAKPDADEVRIGPHPFWRWAVVSHYGSMQPGIGFVRRKPAEAFRDRFIEAFPEIQPPMLLRRRGMRRFEVVDLGQRRESGPDPMPEEG